ncbi:hypothetical protein GGTG_10578 [Gaeumannomyces tritici R3-111a-1]|uniref:Uncharacterized protein n=1 Tax=Gaeumannomyces tritici (strain R3-111a-1) TaxID=644352 RepID=J3PAQ3_GAET3|nr:hypothetical protein GGTG_10578 [Gaeumannomyces tritici R3-111a-1]EJT71319.1 hypothetical protein GGTG_10578 [Gaeumannomyces tritici R3-111a-1]
MIRTQGRTPGRGVVWAAMDALWCWGPTAARLTGLGTVVLWLWELVDAGSSTATREGPRCAAQAKRGPER